MFFEFFDLLLKLDNFLFCGGEFCPKGLQLDFFFGHLRFDLGVQEWGVRVRVRVRVCVCVCVSMYYVSYNIFNFLFHYKIGSSCIDWLQGRL